MTTYRETTCGACGEIAVNWGHQWCKRCYMYRYRHGVDRPESLNHLGTKRPCVECGLAVRAITRRRCRACYVRLWKRERVVA